MRRICTALALCIAVSACGSAVPYSPNVATDLPPTVTRITPASGPVGTTIQIFGFGFSVAAPENVVIIGDTGASATSYDLVANPTSDEIEVLTADIPNDTPLGESSVVVVVGEHVSNADVMFTVTP